MSVNSFPERSWGGKFRDAFRGAKQGARGQSSFFVHFFVAVAVLVAGLLLRVDHYEWCLLLLCIAGVIVAEMFNGALESMAKAITRDSDPHIGNALDIGSAAVLIASIGASLVGTVIFARHLAILLGWW